MNNGKIAMFASGCCFIGMLYSIGGGNSTFAVIQAGLFIINLLIGLERK